MVIKDILKKLKLKFIIPFVAVFLIMAGIFFLTPSIRFNEVMPTLEKGLEYNPLDFISKTNCEISLESETFKTDEVGDFVFNYHIKRWFFERDVPFAYKVVDTTPPHIKFLEPTIVIDSGVEYSRKDVEANVQIDEGTFEYATDYDPTFAGIYTVTIKAVDDYNNESAASYNIVVKDSEPPMILASGENATVLKGSTFDIQNHIAYGDNADPEVTLTVDGKVDTSKIGSYPLHLTLEDYSGNKTEWDITVKVVAKFPKEKESEDYSYSFEDFLKDYRGDGRSFGIDVSSWQREIDYEAARKAGCEFVLMRIAYSDRGHFVLDNQFERNITEAKKAGLKCGVYFFSYDATQEEMLGSLDKVFEYLEGIDLELGITFDWEDFWYFQDYNMSFKDLNHLYDVFEDTVKRKGYDAMLYGSKYYLDTIWSHTDERKIWLAQYSDEPTYEEPFCIWQLSDHGTIDGIEGHVDLDILFETE